MRDLKTFFSAAAVVVALTVSALPAAAQTGRVGGTIKDPQGVPLKGATITAENPAASPSSFTATTDDKGRYSIIGLKTGPWKITAVAPGFAPSSGTVPVRSLGAPMPPVDFVLAPGATGPAGALAGVNTKELQIEFTKAADLANAQKYDEAIAVYQAALAKVPALTQIHSEIAKVQRMQKNYDGAIASYRTILEKDPSNDGAKREIGMTLMEKGDFPAATVALTEASQSVTATREVFYNLGEVLFNGGKAAESEQPYRRASEIDPTWTKPKLKLSFVALNKGDQAGAIKILEDMKASAGECAAVYTGTPPTPQCADHAAAKQMLEQMAKK